MTGLCTTANNLSLANPSDESLIVVLRLDVSAE